MLFHLDYKLLSAVFTAIFIAELGDKTQLTTMLFAANKDVSKLTIFTGASLALILTSALGIFVGSYLAQSLNEKYLNYVAGVGFVTIGFWTLIRA
jgi:putative Ca2+/H+ antiporter (TMEM165/GDT1 family)